MDFQDFQDIFQDFQDFQDFTGLSGLFRIPEKNQDCGMAAYATRLFDGIRLFGRPLKAKYRMVRLSMVTREMNNFI